MYKKSLNEPGGWFVPLVVQRAHYYWVRQSRPPESACLSNGIALYKEVPTIFGMQSRNESHVEDLFLSSGTAQQSVS